MDAGQGVGVSEALHRFVADAYEQLSAREPSYAFTREEYRARLERLRAAMARDGFDLLLVSSPDAMCWLHGYQSRWYKGHSPTTWPPLQCTAVHVDSDELVHFDVAHHAELLRLCSVADHFRLADADGPREYLAFILDDLRSRGWLRGRVGMEHWSHVPNRATSELVQAALEEAGCTVADASATARGVRRIKSPAEIAKLEQAAAVCDAGLQAMQAALRPGITELEAWAALTSGMAARGGEPAALHESVVVGPIELGHAWSSTRPLQAGDVVCADPCGVVDRYHANVERYYVLGAEPSPELLRLAEIEADAFRLLCALAKPGVPVRDVTRTIRSFLQDSGVWGLHNWNGGYEMGCSLPPDWVGEWHFTVGDDDCEDVFEAGMVTNYESIVLYPMIDTVVFEEGGARTLSALPLDVLVAG